MISKKEQKLDIFIPYYINQSRLLDIYAIINGGYSEYSEITSTINTENNKKANGETLVPVTVNKV